LAAISTGLSYQLIDQMIDQLIHVCFLNPIFTYLRAKINPWVIVHSRALDLAILAILFANIQNRLAYLSSDYSISRPTCV
jgi:hypothetical protein